MPNARAGSPWLTGRWVSLGLRLGLLFLLWTALVEGRPAGLALGVLALPLTLWGSVVFESADSLRAHPLRLVGLLWFCAGRLVLGGVDVARRALGSRLTLTPGLVETRCRLPRGPARRLLNGVVGVMPGLHAVELPGGGDGLTLHLLDTRPEAAAAALERLRDLERRVALVFGLAPPPRGLP
ncbi:Na+/H+ antiporter subunit E [Melittangium boletus]|uniref:Cation transporter n=1 Tax=Melittangium boletus DSM 14713 TaxID=1294270 RepID=A0A250IC86_9BACT|nr:Na+/H+ antiporter subunit E [Melittangium boletus]ATB28771.1 cation transporter [Melittangium boletus DSM 14713]